MSTTNPNPTASSSTTGPNPSNQVKEEGGIVNKESIGTETKTKDAPESQQQEQDGTDGAPSSSTTAHTAAAATRAKKRRLGVDPSLIISDERSKRRKSHEPDHEGTGVKLEGGGGGSTGGYDPKDVKRATSLGKEIYSRIMGMKDPEGVPMSQSFIKLPNKRSFPDYYETIKFPMSLEMISEKLDNGSYETLKAVAGDLGQIFNNAKRYNVKESLIFQYAKKLHKMTRTFYNDKTSPGKIDEESDTEEPHVPIRSQPEHSVEVEDVDMGGPSNASADGESASGKAPRRRGTYMKDGPTVYKLVKPVLKAIRETTARDGSGREIAGIFSHLPDRKIFGDYYKTIKDPISLKEIEDKMLARLYQTYEQFFDDVELMCKNAMIYNEDASQPFQDAQQIKDVLDHHRRDIHDRLTRPQVTKFRVKGTDVTPGRPLYQSTPGPNPQYPHQPYPSASPHYPSQSPQPFVTNAQSSSSAPATFLPALPKGVVTEEVVASLERYPAYEQQAWINSLPTLALQMYRQMAAAIDMRKRGMTAAMPTPILKDLPSSGRPNGISTIPDRTAPPHPTIKWLDFGFASPGQPPEQRQAIRLHNMRGVVTHAVVLGSDTTELELTAYIADSTKSSTDTPDITDTTSTPVDTLESIPEVSLRVNGNQGSLPKFMFEGEKRDRPIGMKWIIAVPLGRNETKIEVVATKPGSLAETTSIYVNRQF